MQTVCTRPLLRGEGPGNEATTHYALQIPLLCSYTCKLFNSLHRTPHFRGAVEQVGWFFLAPVCGWAFTLTFHFCQLCGAWSLLIKDIGEETMTCELLPAVWVLLTELLVAIVEFRLTTWQGFHKTLIKRRNFLRESASWCSVWVSFILHCSMPSGSWTPRDKAQERTGCLQWVCLPRKHTFMQLSTNFGRSIPTTTYQTFLFVPNSIKLGRACSRNVYSVPRTKAEIIFMTVYAIHVNRWLSY